MAVCSNYSSSVTESSTKQAEIRHACLSRSDFGYDLSTVNYAKDDDYGQKNMHGSVQSGLNKSIVKMTNSFK